MWGRLPIALAGVAFTLASGARADDATLFRDGEARGAISLAEVDERDLAVLDLSEDWVPPILAPTDFAPTFVALAQGRMGDVEDEALAHRARLDRFLESYGIPPTLAVLRERMDELERRDCGADLKAIERFGGSDIDEDDVTAWESEAVPLAESFVQTLLVRYDSDGLGELPMAALSPYERAWLGRAAPLGVWRSGLEAVRERLRCEGLLRGSMPRGRELDRRTRNALAAFERRHRIYARGRLSGETLAALRLDPMELARRDVLRVLTERARLDWGILADGSAEAPDRLGPIGEGLERAFGLQTPWGTLRWLRSLEARQLVALPAPPSTPEDGELLHLRITIDRGDQSYAPPGERTVRIERRPTLTVHVRRDGEWIALVRWPTTIGGWRIEQERGRDVWRYKESPAGPGVWRQIHAPPVWLPPATTPDADLVMERHLDDGEVISEPKATLLGPGYAGAFGLAAAIHRPLRSDGSLGPDEGIRTHGSVDYTSVWRRASHGCHRLQNHRAIALFSYLLKHRPHRRVGSRPLRYSRRVRVGERTLTLEVPRSGFVYVLDPPVPFEVLEGRVVGDVRRPPSEAIPVD
jgi:hypothetical protein